MIIQTVLTDEEENALLFMLGFATGAAVHNLRDMELAKRLVRVTNKLLANHPNFIPYDPDSLDLSKPIFPFNTVTLQ